MLGGIHCRKRKENPPCSTRIRLRKGSTCPRGYAYKIIRQMNEEQEALGRPVVKGRVRSDHFERKYFAGDEDAGL